MRLKTIHIQEEEFLGIDSIACSLTNAKAMIAARTHPNHLIMESPTTKEKEDHAMVQKSAICGDVCLFPSSNLYKIEIEGRNREETAGEETTSLRQP